MNHPALATEPRTFVFVDPTAPDGEEALTRLDHQDNHVSVVVLLSGPSAVAIHQFAEAEDLDLATAAARYQDQVADRIARPDRLVEVVAVPGPNVQAEVRDLTNAHPTRRVLLPPSATGIDRPRRTLFGRRQVA